MFRRTERDAAVGRDPLQQRLDRLAGLAPGGPEVDDRRPGRREHLRLERLVRDLSHSVPRSAARRSSGTFQIASSTIARDIFEPPTVLSAKRIGTSCTRNPSRIVR